MLNNVFNIRRGGPFSQPGPHTSYLDTLSESVMDPHALNEVQADEDGKHDMYLREGNHHISNFSDRRLNELQDAIEIIDQKGGKASWKKEFWSQLIPGL